MKAFKFRIYPNTEQRELLNKTFGCARFIYNKMLDERQRVYAELKEDKEALKNYKYTTEKQLKQEFEWLREVDAVALQQSRMHLMTAYKHFFKKHSSFPRFKSKDAKQSYHTVITNGNIKVDFTTSKIKLPKVGWMRFRDRRQFDANIRSITVSRSRTGKYYASVLTDCEPTKRLPETNTATGIDLGIKDFVITSEGEVFENLKLTRTNQRKLSRFQRAISRKQKGSNNRKKTRYRLAKLHERLHDKKENYLHHVANSLLHESQVLVIESLGVSGMMKNHKLARSIQELSLYRFKEILRYKAKWYGRDLVEVGKFFPSSKLCGNCGWKNNALELKHREWTCEICGITHDRDLNAANNILNEGLRILTNDTAGTAEIYACGDMLPVGEAAQEATS